MSDKYIANVISHLRFEGSHGSTTFTDQTGRAWTASGNAQITTAVNRFGSAYGDTSSGTFDGSGDYLTTADHADFTLGTSDFTIEAHVRPSNNLETPGTFPGLIGQRTTASSDYSFTMNWGSGFFGFSYNNNVTALYVAHTFVASTWYHVAVCRAGTTFRIFIDGRLLGTSTLTASISNSGQPVRIAAYDNPAWGGSYFPGEIGEFRFTKAARYGHDYAPPLAPFATAKRAGIIDQFGQTVTNEYRS